MSDSVKFAYPKLIESWKGSFDCSFHSAHIFFNLSFIFSKTGAVRPTAIIPNSSPPNLPITSEVLNTDFNNWASALIALSPALCPYVHVAIVTLWMEVKRIEV